ncbi:MAG: methyltransferase domain-containing protein [Calditrichia bacterium]
MSFFKNLALKASKSFREKRIRIFSQHFDISSSTKILDLGSEYGSHIHSVISGTEILPQNVFIADISAEAVKKGQRLYGFTPVEITESGALPFEEHFFDIVYCSSVIEHVTVPKEQVWQIKSGKEFRERAFSRQQEFAREVRRLGKQYFVQTPYRNFIIESHTWLPFIAWLPRPVLIPVLRVVNSFWVKKTSPDWNLLDKKEMATLFPEGKVIEEKTAGLTKSLIAVKVIS